MSRVVVAVDFEADVRGLIVQAAPLARALQARLALVHVSPKGLGLREQGWSDIVLRWTRESFPDAQPTFEHARRPSVAEHLVTIGASPSTRLLVMGGSREARPGHMGANVRRVLHRGGFPLLIVPPGAMPPATDRPLSILLPTDFSGPSEFAARWTLSLSRTLGARVQLIHVVVSRGQPGVWLDEPSGVSEPASDQAALLDEAHENLHAWWRDEDYPAERYACAEIDVSGAICRRAEEVGSDLIVIGSAGRGALGRFFLGSVAATLIRRSPRPVLVHTDR